MEKFLSHLSAAAYWKIPYIEEVLGYEITESRPVEFTVISKNRRYQLKGQVIHLCTTQLPENAVIYIDGQWIASPELVFLQMSSDLSILQLILLGMQMCSHKPGKPNEALTTKEKLKDFLKQTPWHRGHRKCLRAVKYIEDGSNSIMESLAYMAMALPHALGGFALKGATLNHEIKLDDETVEKLKQNCCFADFYYKAAKLAVEYDSYAYHSRPAKKAKDEERAAALRNLGLKFIQLTTKQLYSLNKFRLFIYELAKTLSRRINIRTKKFGKMLKNLRSLFPSKKATLVSIAQI